MVSFSFTNGFRDLLIDARKVAGELRHDYLAPEHIALVMLGEHRARMLAEVLAALRADPVSLATAVRAVLPAGRAVPLGEIPYTPEARLAIEEAMKFSAEVGDTAVAPEHLLFGLVRSATGQLKQVLIDADLHSEQVRAALQHLRGRPPSV